MLSYREALPGGTPLGTLLCVHGYPESSHMWRTLLERAPPAAGWQALAPDLPGYGDSPLGPAARLVAADVAASSASTPSAPAARSRSSCTTGAG